MSSHDEMNGTLLARTTWKSSGVEVTFVRKVILVQVKIENSKLIKCNQIFCPTHLEIYIRGNRKLVRKVFVT